MHDDLRLKGMSNRVNHVDLNKQVRNVRHQLLFFFFFKMMRPPPSPPLFPYPPLSRSSDILPVCPPTPPVPTTPATCVRRVPDGPRRVIGSPTPSPVSSAHPFPSVTQPCRIRSNASA